MIRATLAGRGKVRRGHVVGGYGSSNAGGAIPDNWDPTNIGSEWALSGSNFTGTNSGQSGDWVLTTQAMAKSSGKLYAELLLSTVQADFFSFGIVLASTVVENSGIGGQAAANIHRKNGGWNLAGGTGGITAWTSGDIAGIAYDFSTHVLTIYRNNTLLGTSGVDTMATARVIGCTNNFGTTPNVATLRTTIAQFTYSPPSGYTPWSA